jgi:hypothetical protein
MCVYAAVVPVGLLVPWGAGDTYGRPRNSGLYDLNDTVSLPESLSRNQPQEAVRRPRIDVHPWTHSQRHGHGVFPDTMRSRMLLTPSTDSVRFTKSKHCWITDVPGTNVGYK